MKTYFIKLFFNFTSFLCDLTKGNTLFVKYRLLLGSILIGMSLPACNTGNTSKVSGKMTPMMMPLDIMYEKDTTPDEPMDGTCYDGVTTKNTPATDTVITDPNHIYEEVQEMPKFLANNGNLMSWISANLKYPPTNDCVQGRVTVKFIINMEGEVLNIRIARSLSPAFDKEAVRVIRAMPKWKPGVQNGKNVNVQFAVPVTFVLK